MKKNPHSASTDDRKPFRPSNPMKSGEEGYITKFIRLEPKEAAKVPGKRHAQKTDDRPNFR